MSLKDAKINFIIDTAAKLFLVTPIDQVTIRDIAIAAGIGEATVYRYFGKKSAIVMASIMKVQQFIREHYFLLGEGNTGIERLSIFYHSYVNIFKEHPEFYRLLREFDIFVLNGEGEDLSLYEEKIEDYHEKFLEAYHLGIEDGTVTPVADIELVYISSTHALIELCKKLSLGQGVLKQDDKTPKAEEILCLVNLILHSFRPCAPSASKTEKDAKEEGR